VRARAKLQNRTKLSSYNSKKLAIERAKLQRLLNNRPKLRVTLSEKRGLRNKLLTGRLKKLNATLQPHKKVAIH
jgi:hypothetical protein